MTDVKGTGKIINIKCAEVAIPEFPNLLFGTHFDGIKLFDATSYLQKTQSNSKLSVEDFWEKFKFQIDAIAKAYELSADKLVYINVEGHQLIDGCLCYPFLSYVDPQFCAYLYERMDELFSNGYVVSDTQLLSAIRKRLSLELIKQLWNDNDKQRTT